MRIRSPARTVCASDSSGSHLCPSVALTWEVFRVRFNFWQCFVENGNPLCLRLCLPKRTQEGLMESSYLLFTGSPFMLFLCLLVFGNLLRVQKTSVEAVLGNMARCASLEARLGFLCLEMISISMHILPLSKAQIRRGVF